jgi:drug/metabolite transporter (DMT)-like permease
MFIEPLDTRNTMPESTRKTELLADVGLFYAAVIWGATFVVVRWALTGIDALTMVGYRFLIAGTLLLAYLAIKRRPLLNGWPKALLLSAILWSLYASQTLGLNYTTASNSGFITGLFVVFVPIFLVTLFKRKPTVWEWIASVVSLAGLWILTGGLKQINTGDALTLISAMTYALHLLYSDRYMKAGADPLLISCQQFLLVGAFSLVFSLVSGRSFDVTASAMWWVVFLAIFPTLSAFVIQMFAQKLTSPMRVSLIFAFEPVFAAVFAWTIGGEAFILKSALGGLFIFAGLVMSGFGAEPKPK